MVPALGSIRCQRVRLKCQGCYICTCLDPNLLDGIERWEYDEAQMRNVWNAWCSLNENQDKTVANVTAV
ncbi:MAG TPA: hypothetical protein VGO47_08725 [Chlamydiales bacterium]|nr:hypothetical protein [Chlamydiales bacterium]